MRSMASPPLSLTVAAHLHHHQSSAAPPPQTIRQCPPDHNPPSKPKRAKTIRFRLSQLCQQGQVHLARQLFDEIPQQTTVLWNTLIIGYICNAMPEEAISLYSLMYASIKASPHRNCDAYTYSSVLKACAETKQLLLGKALHCHILRSDSYSSRIVYNSLLNMYMACVTNYHEKCDLVERVFMAMRKRNVVSWNTVISWYTKSGRFKEAVTHLLLMMSRGLRPTEVSFINVFPAVSGLGNIEIANALYGMVVKMGDECTRNLFVVSSAITMFAEIGYPDFARRIFNNCLEKNPHIWNAMIVGYIHNNRPIEALELFQAALEAEDTDSSVDNVTFLLAITAASELQCLDVARQLHLYLIKTSLVSSLILVNAIIAMYSKCGSIGEAFKVFSKMQERDVVSWNTMICSLVQNELDEEGLMLVYEMQKREFLIDDVTITALLSAASNLRNRELGKQVHAYLIRHGIQFNGMESYLIDMYSKSGMIQSAETAFNTSCKCSNDPAVWNAMISGSTQNGFVEQSLIIFKQMVTENNILPNAVTLASILPACSQLGNIASGKELHSFSIRNLLDGNVFVCSALVDMYSKSGSIVYAKRVFDNSAEKNSVTFTNMILGHAQHGMSEDAIVLFHSMREFGISPDAITFVAVLSACSYTGLIDEGLEIFESIEKDYGIRPTVEHYACIVDMLGRVGRVAEAYDFAQRLSENGNVFGIWGSLLAACRIHNNFELGKIVANKLLKMEGADDRSAAGYRVLLSNIYAEEGNWEYVKSIRKEMIDRGVTKDVGCSWINISGYSQCFASRDRRHPQCDEIYQLLKHLGNNLKDADYMPPPFVVSEL